MVREPAQTRPPTFTSLEVSLIFRNSVTTSSLQHLDKSGLLRPSYYYDSVAPGGLITASERDSRVAVAGHGRGDPHRRYTYQDLVWIRLFLKVKVRLISAGVPNAGRRAAQGVSAIRSRAGGECPPAWRLVVLGKELYLVRDDMVESLTRPGQLGLVELFESVEAEIRGRVTALAAHKKIRDFDFEGQKSQADPGGVSLVESAGT